MSGPTLPESSAEPLQAGMDLGRYRVTGKLGAGGMGEVLAVYDERVGREVAAKVVAAPASPRRLAKFLREGQITGQLEHPGIVPLHEMGQAEDGRPYFTMRRIRGRTLGDQLCLPAGDPAAWRPGWLAPLRAFLKICDAVGYAHSRDVIHRDLKPDNVMVGEFGEVLVVDWGLAKARDAPDEAIRDALEIDHTQPREEGSPVRTRDGTVVGTPAYMSPEQAMGQIDEIDQRTDVYALGAILYEILTGRAPYRGPMWAIVEALAQGVPPAPPHTVARDVPRELAAVAAKAMAYDRQQRYADVRQLEDDIEAYIDGRTLGAAQYTVWQRMGKWCARHRGLLAALAAIALVGGGVAGWAHRANVAERERAIAQASAEAQLLAAELPNAHAIRRDLVDLTREDREARIVRERVRRKWQKQLGEYLAAVSALDRALSLASEDKRLRKWRRDLGHRLGWAALLSGNETLARQAFRDLETWGLPGKATRALTRRAMEIEHGILRWRRRRIERIMADLRSPASERKFSGWRAEDYIFETVAVGGSEAVELVGEALVALAAKRKNWTALELDLSSYCCEVLGRLGLPGCVEPLAAWLKVQKVDSRIVEAALALCNTRRAEAYAPLIALARRLKDANHPAWRRVAAQFWRVPEPPAIANTTPTTAKAAFHRAMSRLDRGEMTLAKADFDLSIRLNPDVAETYAGRAQLLITIGKMDRAAADLERAIKLKPKLFQAYNYRGILRRRTGDSRGALADFDFAAKLEPTHPRIHYNRALIRARDLGDNLAAIAILDEAVKFSNHPSSWALLGDLLHMERQDLRAIHCLDRALELDPEEVSALVFRGRILRRSGRFQGALRDLDDALRFDTTSQYAMIARSERAKTRRMLGDWSGARADIEQLLKQFPRYVPAYRERARQRMYAGDLTGALADLTEGIRRDALYPEMYNDRGLVKMRLGDSPGALEDFAKALKVAPHYGWAYINRGTLFNRLGKLDRAEKDFRKAIVHTPDIWNSHFNLGIVLERRKQLAAALTAMKHALTLARSPKVRTMIETAIARVSKQLQKK